MQHVIDRAVLGMVTIIECLGVCTDCRSHWITPQRPCLVDASKESFETMASLGLRGQRKEVMAGHRDFVGLLQAEGRAEKRQASVVWLMDVASEGCDKVTDEAG